jgi:hypothetical protein
MRWKRTKLDGSYASGDYELLRWVTGSLAARWGVFHRGRHIKTVHALPDAKRFAADHRRAWHEAMLEESGNALVGGAL